MAGSKSSSTSPASVRLDSSGSVATSRPSAYLISITSVFMSTIPRLGATVELESVSRGAGVEALHGVLDARGHVLGPVRIALQLFEALLVAEQWLQLDLHGVHVVVFGATTELHDLHVESRFAIDGQSHLYIEL